MCDQADESVNHILSECSKMAQKEYKRRRDWVGKKVHWQVSKRCGFDINEKWYEHEYRAAYRSKIFRRCVSSWSSALALPSVRNRIIAQS